MILSLSYDPFSFRAECSTVESGKESKLHTKNATINEYLNNCFIFEVCISTMLEELRKENYLKERIEFTGTKQDFNTLRGICEEKYKEVECVLYKSLGEVNPFTLDTMEEIINASSLTASAIVLGKENKDLIPGIADELLEYIENSKMEDCVKAMVFYSNLVMIVEELKLPEMELINLYNKASFSQKEGMTIFDLKDYSVAVVQNPDNKDRNMAIDILYSSAYLTAKYGIGTLRIFENAVDFAVGGVAKLFKNSAGEKLFKKQITTKMSKALDEKMDVPSKVRKAGHYAEIVGDATSKIGLSLLGYTGVVGAIISGTFLGLGSAGETVKKAAAKTGKFEKKEYLSGLIVGVVAGTLPTVIGFVSNHLSRFAANITGKLVGKIIVDGGSAAAVKAAQVGVGLGGAAVVGATAGLIFETKEITEEVMFKITGVKDKIEINLKKIAINLAIGAGISCACYLITAIPTLVRDEKELQKTIDAYRDELLKNSECPDTIGEINPNMVVKQSPDTTKEMRNDFGTNRVKLREEWEKLHGRPWPKYEEDIYINGKLRYHKGDNVDAHHIQPLCLGGKNTADNITPMNGIRHAEIHNAVGNKYSAMVDLKETMQASNYMAKFSNRGVEAMAGEFAKEAFDNAKK